jgi:xylulokinase
MPVTVGIDIGTTSVKAVAADDDGTVIARTRIPHRLGVPAPDRLEHDANRAWRWGPRRALAGLHRRDVKAVSVVAMVPSLTAVNKNGIPQTPGLLYGDRRGSDAPSEVEGFAQWALSECPDAAGLWPAQAVANHTLGGEAVVDMSAAGACWGLFSGAIDSERIPRMVGMGEAIGVVQGSDTILDAGGVDAVGEQLTAGAHNPGDVHVLLGTTLIVWAVIPEHREVPGLNTIPHLGVPGLTLIGGPSNAGGLFLNWVSSLLGRGRAIFNPDHVPVWVPYPRGERSPLDDPARRAELHGLDLTHGPASARRAAYEASGFVVRRLLELGGALDGARRVVATGGGVRDPEWVQAVADATQLPVDVAAVPEGAALGAAWLARMAAGLETEMGGASRWASTSQQVEPDALWADAMVGRYERFRALAR